MTLVMAYEVGGWILPAIAEKRPIASYLKSTLRTPSPFFSSPISFYGAPTHPTQHLLDGTAWAALKRSPP